MLFMLSPFYKVLPFFIVGLTYILEKRFIDFLPKNNSTGLNLNFRRKWASWWFSVTIFDYNGA